MDKTNYGEVFLINKPYRWTSFDVVKKVRNTLKIKKVGHAGTLDPLATGLLIVCAGKKTKSINDFMGMDKSYEGTFVLGKTTASFDLEQAVEDIADPSHIRLEDIEKACAQLTGDILQIPPMHSAVKKDGKRVYEAARQGKELKLDPRPVTVHRFDILDYTAGELHFHIQCSKGTYIRSLARDLGEALGVGAYMSALTRTAIGPYQLKDAQSMDNLITQIKNRLHEDL